MVLSGHGIGDGEVGLTAPASVGWGDILKNVVQQGAGVVINRIGADGQPHPVVVPVKEGIPTPLIYIGLGVAGLVVWKMMSKKSRPAVTNPRRRRRRRHRRGRR